MKPSWPVDQSQMFSADALRALSIELVLVEYDGPQVAIWRQRPDGLQAIGVVADADERAARWLIAPTEPVELDALFLGALSLRDALMKHDALVLDADHESGKPLAGWRALWDNMPEEFLPARGALLPTAARHDYAKAAKQSPTMRIAHVENPDAHQIEFSDLAKLLTAQQSLWTAAAQALSDKGGHHRGSVKKRIAKSAVMSAAAAHHGSFEVEIVPADPGTFKEVGDLIKRVTAASDDKDALIEVLRPLRRRFAMAYAKYLDLVAKRRLNVLTRWGDSAAFVGTGTAARVRFAVLDAQSEGEGGEEFQLVGHFTSFSAGDRKFRFSDGDDDYDGIIVPDVEFRDVKVGESTYMITVEAYYDLHGEEEFLLLTHLDEHDPSKGPLKLTPT